MTSYLTSPVQFIRPRVIAPLAAPFVRIRTVRPWLSQMTRTGFIPGFPAKRFHPKPNFCRHLSLKSTSLKDGIENVEHKDFDSKLQDTDDET
jgi:hypothetical protein